MDGFRASIMAVCTLSAVIYIVEGIVAGTRLKGQMKLILELVMIVTALTPFLKGFPELDLSQLETSQGTVLMHSDEIYREELRKTASYNISAVLLEELSKAGISCKKIETYVNISEDDSISIIRVGVEAEDFTSAERIIKSCLGEETEVVNEAL